MNANAAACIQRFFEDNPHLISQREAVVQAIELLIETYRQGNKVLICGNGGSASDSEHIVGEMMKGFLLARRIPASDRQTLIDRCGEDAGSRISDHLQGALPTLSLVSQTALLTAFCNDVDPQMAFAQQVYGYKKEGDLLIGLSTSGNSKNVYYAASVANAFGMKTISMTGCADSLLSGISTITLRSPEKETFKVQEDHIKLYHLLCGAVELELFMS